MSSGVTQRSRPSTIVGRAWPSWQLTVLLSSSSPSLRRPLRPQQRAQQRHATRVAELSEAFGDGGGVGEAVLRQGRQRLRDIVAAEFCLREPTNPALLNGCGLAVVNPPFRFEEEAQEILRALLGAIGTNEAGAAAIDRQREAAMEHAWADKFGGGRESV
mgnify:CR=1 FL=1